MSNVQGDPQCTSASSPLCLPPYPHLPDQSVILESQTWELNFKKRPSLLQMCLGQTRSGADGPQASHRGLCFSPACEE